MIEQPEFNLEIPEKALFLVKERKRYKVIYGGRASGKSWAMARASIMLAMQSKLRILCVRQFQNSIADSIHKLLADSISAMGLDNYFEITQNTIRCYNGSEYIFKGIHNNPQEIKSLEGVDLCLCEEAQNITDESWEILIPTIRKEGSEIWICFNPQMEDDATYRRFVKNPPDDSIVVCMNYMDNPWFPDVMKMEMEYCKKTDYNKYEHIWLGHTVLETDAQIFKGKFELLDFEAEDFTEFYYGADWGFSSDASVLTRCFVEDNCLYIDYESYGVGVEIDELPQLFDKIPESRKWKIRADCARPETISYMARHGFNCVPAEKWKGSIEDGIEFMRSFDKIYIHPRCKNTYEEFKYYSYKKDRVSGDILPIVVDAWNHCLIAGTLVNTKNGLKPIEEITTEDFVLTRKGYKKVKWAGESDWGRVVYKVKTKNGLEIIGTPDHKVLTNRGFCDIISLRYGDKLLTKDHKWLKQQKCLDWYGTDILNQKGEQIGNILGEGKCSFTDLYGKSIRESAGKAMSFTTLMGILKTTTYPIWKKLAQRNIVSIILSLMKGEKKQEKDLKAMDICENGINQKKVLNGTKNMQRNKIGEYSIYQKKNANIVKKHLNQKHTMIDSAQIGAKVLGGEEQDLMMLLKIANGVEKNLKATNIQKQGFAVDTVQDVEVIGIADKVYDITVEDQHEFFANGVLVSNCIDSIRYALQPYIKNRGRMRLNPDWEARVDAMSDDNYWD